MKHFRFALVAVASFASMTAGAMSGGCLGRTNPEDDELDTVGPILDSGIGFDSGFPTTDSTVIEDSAPGVDTAITPDTAPPGTDTFIDFFDIFPIPDSGPIGPCATCVATNCSKQVNTCLNDPTCRTGLTCTVMKCLAGGTGTPDLTCVLGCFGGDFSKAAEAIGAFTCVTGKCGTDCGGLIGGLPGGGGGGGGSSGSGGGSGSGSAGAEEMHLSAAALQSMDPHTRFEFPRDTFNAWSSQIEASACAQGLASCPSK